MQDPTTLISPYKAVRPYQAIVKNATHSALCEFHAVSRHEWVNDGKSKMTRAGSEGCTVERKSMKDSLRCNSTPSEQLQPLSSSAIIIM